MMTLPEGAGPGSRQALRLHWPCKRGSSGDLRKAGLGIQSDKTAAGDPAPEGRQGARASGALEPLPPLCRRGPPLAAL